MGIIEKNEEFVPPYNYNENKQIETDDSLSTINFLQEQPIEHKTVIAVDKDGKFLGKYVGVDIPEGAFPVEVDTDSAFRTWNFETQSWGEIEEPTPLEINKKSFLLELKDKNVLTQSEIIEFYKTKTFPQLIIDSLASCPKSEKDNLEIDFIVDENIKTNTSLMNNIRKKIKYSEKNFSALLVNASKR